MYVCIRLDVFLSMHLFASLFQSLSLYLSPCVQAREMATSDSCSFMCYYA